MKYKKKAIIIVIYLSVIGFFNQFPLVSTNFACDRSENGSARNECESFNKISKNNEVFDWVHIWGGGYDDWCLDELEYPMEIIAVDSSDNIYITGTTESFGSGDTDICIIKFDCFGKQLWNKTWGGTFSEYSKSIVLDSNDNVYILGTTQSWEAGDGEVCVIKYNSSGALQWNITWGSTEYTESAEEVCGLEVDELNNIYVAGSVRGSITGERDFFLFKLDHQGILLWNRTWGLYNDDEWCYALHLDTSDNIYLAGHNSYENACVIKYDSMGNKLWNQTWGGTLDERAKSLAIDSLNNIYMAGITNSLGAGTSDVFIVKFDEQGYLLWNRTWGGDLKDEPTMITIDALDNIYISGITESFGPGTTSLFLLKYIDSGTRVWNCTSGKEGRDWGLMTLDNYNTINLIGII